MTKIADLQRPRTNRGNLQTSDRRAIPVSESRRRPAAQEKERWEGIHPLAFRFPMVAVAWFVISMAISFADTPQTGYLMAIVAGFAFVFFGLIIGLSMRATDSRRLLGSAVSFRRFVRGQVATYGGTISGRDALVQLTVMPVALALGGMAIGLVYLFQR
jgi:hypothetical protein